MGKKDDPLAELLGSVRFTWRHRKGLKLLGRQVWQDNTVPGLILDVFDNLGFVTKDGRKPLILSKELKEYGWQLMIHLPPRYCFSDIVRIRERFEAATNSWVELKWINGQVYMEVQTKQFNTHYPYQWSPGLYPAKYLPIPIGYSRKGLEVIDLTEGPHFLIGGAAKWGKSVFIRNIIHSLIGKAVICIIDLKGLDYNYLENHCILTVDEASSFQLLGALNKEFNRRVAVLRGDRVSKIQHYRGSDMPYIVLVIDELAEVREKETFALIDRLVRLARAVGISVVAASQRTSVEVIKGDTRMNFILRMCFQVANRVDSETVLGDGCGMASKLPGIPGRGIFKNSLEVKEVQVMNLSDEKTAEDLINLIPPKKGWEYSVEPKTKRLPPR